MSTDSPTRRSTRRARSTPTVVLGLLLIAVGLLLLLDRTEVLDAGIVAGDWWPLALVALGLWWLSTSNRLTGALAVAIGVLLLAAIHDVVEADLVGLVFPVVLVTIGTGALTAGARMRRVTRDQPLRSEAAAWSHTPTATAVFGDAKVSVADDGGARAAVSVMAVFGDVQISVPAGWRVVDRTTAMFGSVRVPRDQPTYAEAPVVELHGMAIFGDARVRYLDEPTGA